jgi:hypothetical protein
MSKFFCPRLPLIQTLDLPLMLPNLLMSIYIQMGKNMTLAP